MSLAAGGKLGPYEILSPIGAGGMGEVYKARDTRLHRMVAVKVLPEHIAAREQARARFEREARAVASLNHPNICTLHDIGPNFMVMELIEGETLAARIGKGPIPLQQAIAYATQIADALDRAHRAGVTHRDVKPQNIMLTRDGVKVLDFGLAKSNVSGSGPNEETLTMGLTAEGAVIGTPQYMAPEQFEGAEADARSDIWAFGAVVYEMVTGRKAFQGRNYTSLVAAILGGTPPPMDGKPLTPAWLERFVLRCLQKDPEDRWQSMRDVVLELKSPPRAEADVRGSGPPSRLPWLISSGLGLACLAFALLWLRSERGSAPPLARRFPLSIERGRFVFSPDSRWLLAQDQRGFRLKAHDGAGWRHLPGTEFAYDPFWSSNSSAIGFFASDRLKIVSLADNTVQVLGDAPRPAGGDWRGGVRDGVILFASNGRLRRFDLASRNFSDVRVTASDSQEPARPRFLPEGDGFVFELGADLYRSSLASPDQPPEKLLDRAREVQLGRDPRSGAWHLFYISAPPGHRGALWTAPIDPRTGKAAGTPVRILTQVANTGFTNYAVAPDGAIVWRYARRYIPVFRFRWFDPSGKLLSSFGDAGKYTSLALSPDETQIAVEQLPAGSDLAEIWVYDLQKGTGARLSTEPGHNISPLWSVDGKWIYYSRSTDAGSTVIRRAADGSGQPETLLAQPTDARLVLQTMTPDGEALIVIASEPRRSSIVRLKIRERSGRHELEPLLAESDRVEFGGHARMTRDGKWLLYQGPSFEWWAIPYPPTGAQGVNLRAETPSSPCLSGDGRLFYGRAGVDHWVMQPIASGPHSRGRPAVGKLTILFPVNTPTPAGATICAVSRDGSRILIISTDDTEQLDMQLLTDWTALLRTPDVER